MGIREVFSRYEEDLGRVDDFMRQCLYSEVPVIPEIILHLIGGGGKRIRPLLLLTCADACNYAGERRFAMSAMIEFIHTASLLHDDVIDHAETRRGKASANNIWGDAASILVGDFLYSRAFKLMTDDGDLAIIGLLCSTANTMTEGEVFQLMRSGKADLTEEEYLAIIEKKTSTLIATACTIGAMLAGASPAYVTAFTGFGLRIGSAFQITDDTLDYEAEEGEFGKSVGKDLQEGKITLPLIHALHCGTPMERDLITETITREEQRNRNLPEIMSVISRRGGIAYARAKAEQCVREGKEFLGDVPPSAAKDALFTIADYVLERRT